MPRLTHGLPDETQSEPLGIGAQFTFHLERLERVCDALEALADALPYRIDTHFSLVLARELPLNLHRTHRFEEEIVHPILLSCHPHLAGTLGRLRDEHLEDEDRAQELREAIAGLVGDRSRRDAEVVGYMLRGVFTGLRRHLAVEREQFLPLLSDHRAG